MRTLAAGPTHGWDGATAAALSPRGARQRGGAARPWLRCHLERSARVRDCARGDGGAWPMAVRHAEPRATGQGGGASASADETRARVWVQRERIESIVTRERERATASYSLSIATSEPQLANLPKVRCLPLVSRRSAIGFLTRNI